MTFVGIYLVNHGPQFLYPIAGITGLISNVPSQTVIVPSTLLTVAPSNYSYVSVELMRQGQIFGHIQVEGGSEIGFYIMNKGNFSEWRHNRSAVIELAKPNTNNYNFTYTSRNNGPYYLVFNNQDQLRKNVVFNLSNMETIAVPNPLIQYSGYEVLIIGLLLSAVSLKSGLKKPKSTRASNRAKCKFCGNRKANGVVFCPKCGRSQT